MAPCLLDADILSEILKQKNPTVVQKAAAYLQAHQQFTFSAITSYEVIRGLKAKGATRQLAQFETFCHQSLILPLTDGIFDSAADLWVTTHASGRPQKDAELLIAATALVHGLTLVTGKAPAAGVSVADPLEAAQQVKALVDRYGAETVKSLADLLARIIHSLFGN
jgi:tRNA(fMet)-specific endonuclease VapC